MRNALIVAAVGMMLVGVGCENGKMKNPFRKDKPATTQPSGDMKMSSAKDDCPYCPGVQKATSDGKCPACKGQVKG